MKYLLSLILLVVYLSGSAQFERADLRAAGLTCAMCSNAINKSLKTLHFIREVDVDLNRSSFQLIFKEGENVDLDAVRRKVEDAGFSIAQMTITADFHNTNFQRGVVTEMGTTALCFINAKEMSVKGKRSFKIVERGFLLDKEYKKNARLIQPGEQCRASSFAKIYHVLLL